MVSSYSLVVHKNWWCMSSDASSLNSYLAFYSKHKRHIIRSMFTQIKWSMFAVKKKGIEQACWNECPTETLTLVRLARNYSPPNLSFLAAMVLDCHWIGDGEIDKCGKCWHAWWQRANIPQGLYQVIEPRHTVQPLGWLLFIVQPLNSARSCWWCKTSTLAGRKWPPKTVSMSPGLFIL